jgi:hypothetical protein
MGTLLQDLVFSPDSKSMAYVAWRRGGKQLVVVDGVEGKEYDGFLGSGLVFDTRSQFHTLADNGDEFFRVEVEIVMPAAESPAESPTSPATGT